MALDPIIGLPELLEGSALNYLSQNQRNLIVSRLAIAPVCVTNNETYPAAAVARGGLYVVGSATPTSHWANASQHDIAIALSADPVTERGWFFLTPVHGIRMWVLAGSPTGHVVWNGAAWVAV